METSDEINHGSLHVSIGVSGRQPCFSRTVYLTVSLKRFTELLLLLQPNATPCLEHLTVIFEHEYTRACTLESRYEPKDMLTESYLATICKAGKRARLITDPFLVYLSKWIR